MKKIILRGLFLGILMFLVWNIAGQVAVSIIGIDSFKDYSEVKVEYRTAEFGY